MARLCGTLTCLCLLSLLIIAVSQVLVITEDEDAHAENYIRVARNIRNFPRRPSRRGNEGIAVDSANSGRRRGRGRGTHGNTRTPTGGRREGPRRGGRGGRGRGGRRRPVFTRRERNLLGRMATGSTEFSLNMYNTLRQNHPELVFSPFSIHTALTMTYLGARNQTARQMMRVLGLRRLRNNTPHLAYAALLNSLTDTGNVTLNVANAVYVKPHLPIEETFRSGLTNMYKAQFDHFDYTAEGGPEAPINAWVAEKTENKIQDLLSPNTIGPRTALIIVNAIYFKGTWKDKFDLADTTQQSFYRDDGSTIPVQMMQRTGSYKYTRSSELGAHIVELPYKGDRFSMYVILPVTRNTLSDVESALSVRALNSALQQMTSIEVELHLPRFKSESKFSLKDTLRAMRMTVPFSGRANFSGICSTQQLSISEVIHQALMEVTEEGTEAAAATAVIVQLSSALIIPDVTRVRADHPFLHLIRDDHTGSWMFMGKYSGHGESG